MIRVRRRAIRVGLQLEVTIKPVRPAYAARLSIERLASYLLRRFLLLLVMSATDLSSTLSNVGRQDSTRVYLSVTRFVVARDRGLERQRLAGVRVVDRVRRNIVLVATHASGACRHVPVLLSSARVLTIASLPYRLSSVDELFTDPLLMRVG